MRKTAVLLLCLTVLLLPAGCKKEQEKKSHSIDIAYFADMGTFSDCEFKIGELLPEKEQLEADGYEIFPSAEPSYVTDGRFNYYYRSELALDVVSLVFNKIACFDNCLGFEMGAVSIEVSDALDEQNIEYTEREPKEDELFFLPDGGNRSVIVCGSLKNPLLFVFENSALCAVLMG